MSCPCTCSRWCLRWVGMILWKSMVERSHQIPSHEGYPETSSNFVSNMSSNANGDQRLRWTPGPGYECLAISRAGDKPGLIMPQPEECFSQLSHGLLDSSLLLQNTWEVMLYTASQTASHVLMNAPISSTACIFSKGQSLFAHREASPKHRYFTSEPSLPYRCLTISHELQIQLLSETPTQSWPWNKETFVMIFFF